MWEGGGGGWSIPESDECECASSEPVERVWGVRG